MLTDGATKTEGKERTQVRQIVNANVIVTIAGTAIAQRDPLPERLRYAFLSQLCDTVTFDVILIKLPFSSVTFGP